MESFLHLGCICRWGALTNRAKSVILPFQVFLISVAQQSCEVLLKSQPIWSVFGEACNFFEKSSYSSQHLRAPFAQLAVCVSLEKDRIVSFELLGSSSTAGVACITFARKNTMSWACSLTLLFVWDDLRTVFLDVWRQW